MQIEQAIFTSARTERGDGYQLVAVSPGVTDEDQQALRVWSPSHGSLLPGAPRSVNFYRLPSGACCVARTTPAGAEFSGRGGDEIFTHSLLVPGGLMAKFANDPFALLRAAEAGGHLKTEHQGERQLPPFSLLGRASAVNVSLVNACREQWGEERMCAVIDAVLTTPQTRTAGVGIGLAGVSPGFDAERLLAGVLACLPVECRTAISFATGLRHSARRPFRVIVAHADDEAARRLQREGGFRTVNLVGDLASARKPGGNTAGDWARFVADSLSAGGAELLAARLSAPQSGLTLDDLPALARELEKLPMDSPGQQPARTALAASSIAQAHAAHQRFGKSREPRDAQPAEPPARIAGPLHHLAKNSPGMEAPRVVEQLEALDDAVYDTIAGRPEALAQLRALWPQVLAELGPDVVEESREHYLIYALRIWEEFSQVEHPPQQALYALDVLDVLIDPHA